MDNEIQGKRIMAHHDGLSLTSHIETNMGLSLIHIQMCIRDSSTSVLRQWSAVKTAITTSLAVLDTKLLVPNFVCLLTLIYICSTTLKQYRLQLAKFSINYVPRLLRLADENRIVRKQIIANWVKILSHFVCLATSLLDPKML